jgi:branched-subunit amino acid transport protein AzlD
MGGMPERATTSNMYGQRCKSEFATAIFTTGHACSSKFMVALVCNYPVSLHGILFCCTVDFASHASMPTGFTVFLAQSRVFSLHLICLVFVDCCTEGHL